MADIDSRVEEIRAVVEAGTDDRAYWHSCTPQERMWARELMRQRAYGYDEHSVPQFQRVFEVVKLKRYDARAEHESDSVRLPEEQP